jgi:hypothetical protein
MKSKIFFTLPHNNPAGGVKVVNEFVNLFIDKGYESYLCLPEEELKLAAFLNKPAPVITLDDMVELSNKNDVIILGWQSKKEYFSLKKAKAKVKVLWQHGILIPNKDQDIGDLVYKENVINQFWNVSFACGDYIKKKYNLNTMYIVNPFFEIDSTNLIDKKDRKGFLLLNRRGSKYIPRIKSFLKEKKQSLTILNEPYDSDHFINLLKIHKYFLSIDNGLKYGLTWKQRIKGQKLKWIKHDKNYLGFPVPPVEAALSKTIVIGFAMGGGLEWMSQDCMFLAKDDSLEDLLSKIKNAVETTEKLKTEMSILAYEKTNKFSKESSWRQITKVLEIENDVNKQD